ncbi:MAG: hypothetical protein M3442_17305, partial [Chloroflexota bacterium]|nr:hypothetical protein [Chloroflexota bacterium]
LHPMRRAGSLWESDVARLHESIRRVLEVAVPVGGALVKVGRAIQDVASGRDFLRAHGRAGEACLTCLAEGRSLPSGGRGDHPAADGSRIVRLFLAGRGTYFCPVCQPAPAEL